MGEGVLINTGDGEEIGAETGDEEFDANGSTKGLTSVFIAVEISGEVP